MKKNQHVLKQKMIFFYQGSTTYLPEINANCCFFFVYTYVAFMGPLGQFLEIGSTGCTYYNYLLITC